MVVASVMLKSCQIEPGRYKPCKDSPVELAKSRLTLMSFLAKGTFLHKTCQTISPFLLLCSMEMALKSFT